MATAMRERAVDDARSVGSAAAGLARAVRSGNADLEAAVDRLELQASQAVGEPVAHFDAAGGAEPTAEDLLAAAVSQLGIGMTLISAESALSALSGSPGMAAGNGADELDAAAATLERTADVLEADEAAAPGIQAFDTRPDGVLLGVSAAAFASLDEMAATAAEVATAVLDKTLKPFVSKMPPELRTLVRRLQSDVPGRLARWGMRAVRRGLDLLLGLIDLQAIERARQRVDEILAKLGRGEDAVALAGSAIGVDEVRKQLAKAGAAEAGPDAQARLVNDLAELAERFTRLGTLLRRIAGMLAGLAGMLALAHVTMPHALAVATTGLVLVLGAMVVMGRDFTGATDLPGPVRGVRLLVLDGDVAA